MFLTLTLLKVTDLCRTPAEVYQIDTLKLTPIDQYRCQLATNRQCAHRDGTNGRIRDRYRNEVLFGRTLYAIAAMEWRLLIGRQSAQLGHGASAFGADCFNCAVCVCAARRKTRTDRTTADLLEGEMTTCESEKMIAW